MGWGFAGAVVGAVVDVADDGWDAATDFVEETVDDASDAVAGVGGAAWSGTGGAASWFGSAAIDTIGFAGGAVGPSIAFTAGVVNTATGGLAEDVLELADDVVLDTVDAATGGIVDLDYDDGQFTSSVGIDDVVGMGLSIGEDGLAIESDTLTGGFAMGLTNDGVSLEVSAGVPGMMPLPYSSSRVEVSADGDVSIGGEVQGVVPTPYGLLAGQASGGFEMTEEGWMATGQASGTLYTPDGVEISGAVGLTYAETATGSVFDAAISGSVSNEFGSISGGAGYTRIEEDGEVLEIGYAEGKAEGFGMEAGARADYVGVETDEGSVSMWETDARIDGLDVDSVAALGKALLGEAGVEVPDSVDEIVGALGEGGTQELIEQLGESDEFDALVGSLGGEGATALVGKMTSDGTSGDFMGQLGEAATSALIAKASDSDALEDLLGGLDAEQTADLVRNLSAAATGAVAPDVTTDSVVDGPTEDDDLLGSMSIGDTAKSDAVGDPASQSFDELDVDGIEQLDELPVAEFAPVEDIPQLEEEASTFETAIAGADEVEDSLDDLFDEID